MDVFGGAIDYFVRGGSCMWPLLGCSLAAVVIGAERVQFFKQHITDKKFNYDFAMVMNKFNLQEGYALAKKTKGDTADLAVEIMDIEEDLGSRLENIIYAKADRYIEAMEENMSYLNIIIGISPMLGLLGTITGMIGSFNALDVRVDNPMAVTAGIGEALITTVFGLGIAIIGICVHGYFSKQLREVEISLEELSNTLMEAIVRDMCDDDCDHKVKGK